MAVGDWLLLLSLLILQTAKGREFHLRSTDARDILESDLEDWEPKRRQARDEFDMGVMQTADDDRVDLRGIMESDLEDWERQKLTDGEVCGVPRIAPSTNVRVVGGVEAIPHSWPWMVSLQRDGRHFCGGSIINSQWLVSAAHCAPPRGVSIDVVVGLHQQSQPDSFTVRVPVSDVIPSRKFNNPMSPWATRGTSDIMLLKLAHPVEFNDAVSPVCLPTLFQILPPGKRCYSSGWGRLATHGDSPDQLMQVMLPVIDNDICNQPGWHNHTLDDSMVCAGYADGELGNCYGDSGGPLVCYAEGHWLLYGIVSWGSLRGCAAERGPTVYARASAYVRWINQKINENSP